MNRFWRERASAAGFTLVELVVVIAILGILGGIGTVAYSGYMESTKKGLDRAMVGEISRALDISSYVPEFTKSEPIQIGGGGIKIPLGFIVVTQDGSKAVESATQLTEQESVCTLETKEFVTLTPYTYDSGCGDETAYYISNRENITYCVPHSSVVSRDMNIGTNASDDEPAYQTVNLRQDSILETGHHEGDTNTVTGYDGNYTQVTNGVLDKAMAAAFGSGYQSTLRLHSDQWNLSTIPSIYTEVADMWTKVEELATTLMDSTGGESELLGIEIMGDNHTSTAELVDTFAQKVVAKQDAFVAGWTAQGRGEGNGNQAFGLNADGREYYCAARTAYNHCFAAYLEEHGHSEHVEAVANYGEAMAFVGTLPKAIDRAILETDIGCQTCAELYDQYVSSGASDANCQAMLDTMNTISQTGENVLSGVAGNSTAFFDYYETYLKEFEGLYRKVREYAQGESAIVISVFSEDGRLTYDVSPTDAVPDTAGGA